MIVLRILDELERKHGAVYSPFARRDGVRFAQVYFAKLPAAIVALFPQLNRTYAEGSPGAPYRRASGRKRQGKASRLYTVDPEIYERGLAGHQKTEDAVARAAAEAGWTAFRARAGHPNFDLLLVREGVGVVVEVKSTTKQNAERQLRLGLGQVLRYRQQLSEKPPTGVKELHAALVAERRPEPAWGRLCKSLAVKLGWRERPDVWP